MVTLYTAFDKRSGKLNTKMSYTLATLPSFSTIGKSRQEHKDTANNY